MHTAWSYGATDQGSQPGQACTTKQSWIERGDGVTDVTDDVRGDLPYVTMV